MYYPSMPCSLTFTAQRSDLIDISVALHGYNEEKKKKPHGYNYPLLF